MFNTAVDEVPMIKYNSVAEYYADLAPKPPAEGQWQTVDSNATWPSERSRALAGRREFQVLYGPEASQRPGLPWVLLVREIGDNNVFSHIHYGAYRTEIEAQRGGVQWGGPKP